MYYYPNYYSSYPYNFYYGYPAYYSQAVVMVDNSRCGCNCWSNHSGCGCGCNGCNNNGYYNGGTTVIYG